MGRREGEEGRVHRQRAAGAQAGLRALESWGRSDALEGEREDDDPMATLAAALIATLLASVFIRAMARLPRRPRVPVRWVGGS